MTAFDEPDRWTLTVEFDTPEEQCNVDPENVFPRDEVTRFVQFMTSYWSLLPEEIDEVIRWTDTRVVATVELLDQIADPLQFLLMHTVPKQFTVTRNYR